MTTDERAQRALDLSQQILDLAGTPREAFTAEHAAAQNALASLGVELAELMLGVRKAVK